MVINKFVIRVLIHPPRQFSVIKKIWIQQSGYLTHVRYLAGDMATFSTIQAFFYIYKFIYLIYLFLAALGLHCCTWAFSSCGECGLLFVAVCVLLIAVASLVAKHRPQISVVVVCRLSSCGSRALERRLSSCGTRAQLLCGIWDLPGPGLEPVSPALAGGFLTTAPPGKSQAFLFLSFCFQYYRK